MSHGDSNIQAPVIILMGERKYTYTKYKEENIQLKKEVEELKSGLVKTRGVPDFLFSSEASNEELYTYLKEIEDRDVIKYIFNKYHKNNTFIRNLAQKGNPLYLAPVAKALELRFEVEDLHKERARLQSEINAKKSTLNREPSVPLPGESISDEGGLVQQIEKAEKKLFDLNQQLMEKQKEIDSAQSQLANLLSDPGFKDIKRVVDIARKIKEDIEERTKRSYWEGLYDSQYVSSNKEYLDVLFKSSEDLEKLLNSESLLSSAQIDSVLEERTKEYNEAVKALEYVRDSNIPKLIGKFRRFFNTDFEMINSAWNANDLNSIQLGTLWEIKGKEEAILEKIEVQIKEVKE